MMGSRRYDVAVIGGGIVGMAAAMALTVRFRVSLVVLEAEERLAAHQSGHNSGVIHSGLYYRPGSLKARNCVAGREAMYRFCQEAAIPHERCGKIVVAVHDHELGALEELEARGRANGLQGLRRLHAEEIREREPHAAGIAGLLVPDTGIVDFARVTEAFAERVRRSGGEVWTRAAVLGVRASGGELALETRSGAVSVRYAVNCAGLQCDRVARMSGADPDVRIVPFRGEYYELSPGRRWLVRNLIYPVPDARFPFLGVHFTRTIHGTVEAGPNAVLAFGRHGYGWSGICLTDLAEMALYPGFRRMVRQQWRTGLGEFGRSLSKRAFVRALQRLLPALRAEDVHRAGAGVRAQAVQSDGRLVDDFRIVGTERMIHVLNAPSPAATASISIGHYIADLAGRSFDLRAARPATA
jgi:L-2-hydroxyglutarate oxidase